MCRPLPASPGPAEAKVGSNSTSICPALHRKAEGKEGWDVLNIARDTCTPRKVFGVYLELKFK